MSLRVPDVADKAYDALAADATLTTLLGGTAKVYSHVPEDTTSPYVQVLGAAERPWAEGTNEIVTREVDVDVDVWSAYRGTKEVDDVGSRVHTVLTTDGSWSGLSGFVAVRFVESPRPIAEFLGGVQWFRRRVTLRVFLS